MLFSRLFQALFAAATVVSATNGLSIQGKPNQLIKPYKRAPLQDIVTWDEHSIFVRGERIIFFSGEFHPFRLPSPGLWLDVFQKVKAAGFTGVSFYVDWALLEGKQGNFTAEGVFAFEPFFDAAAEAGIYLLARPGPYINAEASGGGFPGWLSRYKAIERTPDYVPLSDNYVKNIGAIIAKAQITNGGPVILVQPENEYSQKTSTSPVKFPDPTYFSEVEDQLRDAGIVMPFVSNDAFPHGYFAPGTGLGAVDIYGHDGYPLGFDCANPYNWPDNSIPTYYLSLHLQQSPNTPYTITEFQGGSFDPWGGNGWAKCTALLNQEFERVFYKNNYAIDVTIFNLYMIFGGTNWGNLGHPGGYTSYDYGASIAEDRTITREKYSEVKLQGNFLKASPAYLTGVGGFTANGSYVNTPEIAVTRLSGNVTNFYIVRHAAFNSLASTNYKLEVPTSAGNVSIPQLSSTLTLNGRDSKIHPVDYDVGGIRLLYSSAEVFTWKKYASKTILVLYSGANETHEAAFVGQKSGQVVAGSGVQIKSVNGSLVLNWPVTTQRRIVKVGSSLEVYLLDRNSAYNYWVLDLPAAAPALNYTTSTPTSVIVHAGYLLRTASVHGSALALTGDLNATTPIEIIGAPQTYKSVTFNGQPLSLEHAANGILAGTLHYIAPKLEVPDLSSLTWKYIDSLPEIQPSYDDSLWPNADHKTSNNTIRNLTTPVSLYSSDYGFNTGNLVTRGHFKATGAEKNLSIETQGGTAYASIVYLNSTLIGTFPGNSANESYTHNITLPSLVAGTPYTITVLTDNMGLGEDGAVGQDGNKDPRGVLDYQLGGRPQSAITWKITGNLGGEDYKDRTRGPLNEGGLYAERQGYHLPNPPTASWVSRKPTQGISKPGVGFFTTNFKLDVPAGYDVPMSFVFANSSGSNLNYRSQLYVNGWQFGKYVNNIGPQTSFPVPEGILNHHGTNYIAVSLWGFDAGGNKLAGLKLVPTAQVQTGYGRVATVDSPAYAKRAGAY